MPQVGARIKEARKNAGLTQKQLAARIGCKQNEIWRWECGVVRPTIKTLCRIAEALGCKPADLMGWEDIG